MNKYILLDMQHMDWKLLREQKLWLIDQDSEQAEGLLNLIDFIQDSAVESGLFTLEEVFSRSFNQEEA